MPNITCAKCGKTIVFGDRLHDMLDDDDKTKIKICQECYDKWKEKKDSSKIRTKRCKNCKNKMGGWLDTAEDYEMEGYCIRCAKDIESQKEEKEYEKEGERWNSLSPNEQRIEEEIEELEEVSIAVIVLVILGILGLFLYLSGIILLIVATIVSSSRKSKAASLRAQLEILRRTSKPSSVKKESYLDILKKQFAEGKLTKKEYLEKKNVLEEK